jgi:probable F420-dependent oxidoreductase
VSGPSAHPRPFRFGVQCSSPPEITAASWAALARKVEDLGYTRLTVSDHLDEQLAPISSLMAAADATTTLRLGAMVFSNDYRHPVVLAKEAATLDVLSDGRFELGLGAGWMLADYQRAGLPLDPAPVRIARLAESIEVLKRLFRDEPCTFEGTYYRIDGLQGTPRPVQRPHPPIVIGGGGRRLLELAAREADVIGLNPRMATGVIDASAGPDATADATARKIGWIREAAGDRFPAIELQSRIHLVAVTDDRMALAEALAPGFGLSPEEAIGSPHTLCGTIEQIVDDLVERRERFGLSSVGIGLESLDALAPVVAKLAGT